MLQNEGTRECCVDQVPFQEQSTIEENRPGSAPKVCPEVFDKWVILKTILGYMSVTDLLHVAFVNKAWRDTSREILKRRKCLFSYKEENCCEELDKAFDFLSTGSFAAECFDGFVVVVDTPDDQECSRDVAHMQNVLLQTIRAKKLSLYCGAENESHDFKFLKEALYRNSETLEFLYLKRLPIVTGLEEMLGGEGRGSHFPKVSCLKFGQQIIKDYLVFREVLGTIIQSCDNLQIMQGYLTPTLISYAVHKARIEGLWFSLSYATLTKIKELIRDGISLKKLRISTEKQAVTDSPDFYSLQPCQRGEVIEAFQRLLEASQTTVVKIQFDLPDLLMILSKWELPKMETVKTLKLVDVRTDDRCPLDGLERYDWKKIFPNLQNVAIMQNNIPDVREAFSGPIRNAFPEMVMASQETFHFTSVKRVDLSVTMDSIYLQSCARLFPNCERVMIKNTYNLASFFPVALTGWKALRYMGIVVDEISDEILVGSKAPTAISNLEQSTWNSEEEMCMPFPSLLDFKELWEIYLDVNHPIDTNCESVIDGEVSETQENSLSIEAVKLIGSTLPNLIIQLRRDICTTGKNCRE